MKNFLPTHPPVASARTSTLFQDGSPQPTPGHDRIKIAWVGLNYGKATLAAIHQSPASQYFELVGVCDLSESRAVESGSYYEVPFFTDYNEMLRTLDLEAIALFTGPFRRGELIRQAVRAGKHVLTTKPFETDPEEAASTLREATRLGRIVHLNSPGPTLSPDLVLVRDWQQDHNLGMLVGARGEAWAGYREVPDGSWYDDPASCPLGPMFRLGIYLVNDLVQLCGPASCVHALESRLFTKRPTADNSQIGLLFENGAIGNIYASFCVADGDYFRNSLTLNFENGTIYKNQGHTRTTNSLYGSELSLVKVVDGRRSVVEQAEMNNGSGAYQWENFWKAVRGHSLENAADPSSLIEGLRIIQAMARASTQGGTCNIKREPSVFTANGVAPASLATAES
ncbi:hypothetical protein BH09VER1_BH09VER1_07560 [soil metagenome]